MGYSDNRSLIDNTHPCYEIDTISYTLTQTPTTLCVSLYILLSSMSVLIVCGNLLVIISVIYFRQLHTPTNFLILSLAVSDLFVGVLIFPLSTRFPANSCFYFHNVFCKVRESFDLTLTTSSILNLCCISVDRYYAVCQPLTYRTKINVKVVAVMIAATWSTSFLVAVGFLIARSDLENCRGNCFYNILLANILGPVFSFYLPVVVMVCIYLKILLVAQKQARSLQTTSNQSTKPGAKAKKAEGKATRTLAIVMGLFLLCWLPIFLCLGFQLIDRVSVPIAAFETLAWVALSNSLLNPFIYAFFYSWFRSAFRLIISGKIFQGDISNSKLL